VRHVATGYVIYDIPNFVPSIPRLGKGWQINALLTVESGSPFSVYAGQNISNSFAFNDRANLAGDPYSGVVQPANTSGNWANGYRWFNPAAFALPAEGSFGTTKRNQFYGPGFKALDLSIFKDIPMVERVTLQFRAEIFNIFNWLNLANPDTNLADGSAMGLIYATRASNNGDPAIGPGEPRNIQLALKVIF
jgi:hypothetical protein